MDVYLNIPSKLSNDIITAMREEMWAVNQMQLAAFYENHVLPMREERQCRAQLQASRSTCLVVTPQDKENNGRDWLWICYLLLMLLYMLLVGIIICKFIKYQLQQVRQNPRRGGS